MITGLGIGLLFVPMSLVSLTKVRAQDTGAASSLLNVGQQVGGSIGLAILGTVAWSAVANSLRSQTAAAAAAKAAGHQLTGAAAAAQQHRITGHALASGFSKGYEVSAGIALLSLIITVAAIRVTRQDLAGAGPNAEPAGCQGRVWPRPQITPACTRLRRAGQAHGVQLRHRGARRPEKQGVSHGANAIVPPPSWTLSARRRRPDRQR
jgi:hypothetical protein